MACATALAAAPAAAGAATIHVTSLADSGPHTLRQAIATAPAGSTILVPAGTIKLTTTELDITKKLEIDGTGAGATIVSGNDAHQVFSLAGAAGVRITKLAVTHGRLAQPGGAENGAGVLINSTSSLTLDSVRVTNNVADVSGDATHTAGVIDGGAISNRGTLALLRSAVDHNVARADGGAADNPGAVVNGGAIYNNGSLSVTSTSISGNTASVVGHGAGSGGVIDGGVVYNNTGDLAVIGGTLNGNVAQADGGATGSGGVVNGGAIYNNGLNLTLTRTSISGNTASAVGHGAGSGGVVDAAGVYNNGEDLFISAASINGNAGHADGGATGAGTVVNGDGVYHNGNKLTIARTSVSNNSATATAGSGQLGGVIDGAGVYDSSSSPNVTTISDSRIGGNSANADGGPNGDGTVTDGIGMYLNGYQATISATTVDGNRGTARGQGSGSGGSVQGGGIYDSTPATMTNLTVTGNSLDATGGSSFGGAGGSASGGGIYGNDAITLLNSTIADNSVRAPGLSPGIARGGNLTHAIEPTHVKNTIVSGGLADAGYENCREPFSSDGHNIDSLNQCGFNGTGDQINTKPLLAPLRFNGGPVPTRGLFALSPARNKGDNVGCPSTDARGAPRPAFGICDIGAFEAQPAPLIANLKAKPNSFEGQKKGPSTTSKKKGKPRGTTVSYSDSRASFTTFTVLKRLRGVRKGKLCVAPPKKKPKGKHPKRCTRYVPAGTFTHQDVAGANHFHFTGRVRGHKLSPGKYRLSAVASLWAVSSKPKTAGFTIIP